GGFIRTEHEYLRRTLFAPSFHRPVSPAHSCSLVLLDGDFCSSDHSASVSANCWRSIANPSRALVENRLASRLSAVNITRPFHATLFGPARPASAKIGAPIPPEFWPPGGQQV